MSADILAFPLSRCRAPSLSQNPGGDYVSALASLIRAAIAGEDDASLAGRPERLECPVPLDQVRTLAQTLATHLTRPA